MKKPVFSRVSVFLAAVFVIVSCKGSTSSSSAGTTVTITGAAKTTVSGKPGLSGSGPHWAAMSGGTVEVDKISPDGTSTVVTTGTVDSNGNFSVSVPPATAGTGASTDFFYTVKATDPSSNTVSYPLAPAANTSITLTPATTLASDQLVKVMDNPNLATNPTPAAAVINAAAALVSETVVDLGTKTTLPAVSANATTVLAAANAVSAAGGNAEASYRAAQFASEYAGFKADLANADTDTVAAYLIRISNQSCESANAPLALVPAQALAAALKAGTTYTATDVISAYQTATGQTPANSATTWAAQLTAADTPSTALTDLAAMALLTKRDLTGSAFGASTAMQADQALSFLIHLGSASGSLCQTQSLPFAQAVAALTGSSLLTSPKIMNYEVYNDMTGACNGTTQGHLMVDSVQVFIPKTSTVTLTGVTIQAAGLNSGTAVPLTLQNDRYRFSSTDNYCVTFGTSVNYTITANLSAGSPSTQAVTRTHPKVPEPQLVQMNATNVSGDQTAPTMSTDKRPIFSWTKASDLYATITTPPAGSSVKYTYEYSHYVLNSGGPINPPTTACPGVNTGGARKLYTADHFIPAADCQPTTCGATQGTTADKLMCRMYVNAWLVDKNDHLLGQAAGTFRYYCPDSNADGKCD